MPSAGPPSGPRPRACWTRSSAPSSRTPRSPRSGTASRAASPATSRHPRTALGAALIRPLVVANSSFSQEITEQERTRAAEAVPDVLGLLSGAWRDDRPERRPDRRRGLEGDRVLPAQRGRRGCRQADRVRGALGAGDRPPAEVDLALPREFWHRNNVLLLLSLLMLVAGSRSRSPRARQSCPTSCPRPPSALLVTVLLDAGVAMVVTGILALLGRRSSAGVEFAAYILFGGVAGVIVVRRGERLGNFVQAGIARVRWSRAWSWSCSRCSATGTPRGCSS